MRFARVPGLFAVILMGANACTTRVYEHSLASETLVSDFGTADLMVMGDIQRDMPLGKVLRPDSQANSFLISKTDIERLEPDFRVFGEPIRESKASDRENSLSLKELIRETGVSAVFQVGDLVDWNNGLEFATDARTYSPQGDEWKVLDYFPPEVPLFMAAGNHEAYSKVTFKAKENGEDLVFASDSQSVSTLGPDLRRRLLKEKLPALVDVQFVGRDASYLVVKDSYVLFALDSISFGVFRPDEATAVSTRTAMQEQLTEIDAALGDMRTQYPIKRLIVVSHYTFFPATKDLSESGLDLESRESLLDLFEKHRVSLVFNGHHHTYVRFSKGFLKDAGFSRNPSAVYSIVGAFANPYVEKGVKKLLNGGSRFDLERDNQAGQAKVDKVVYVPRTHFALLNIDGSTIQVKVFALSENAAETSPQWEMVDQYNAPVR